MTNNYVDIRDELAEQAQPKPLGLGPFMEPKIERPKEPSGEQPWYTSWIPEPAQKGLGWLTENILDPFGATMWAGFTPQRVEGLPSWAKMVQPEAARAGVAWATQGRELQRQYAEEVPWWQKLGYEAPLFAVPGGAALKGVGTAARGVRGLGWAGRPLEATGRAVTGAERAIAAPITAPARAVGYAARGGARGAAARAAMAGWKPTGKLWDYPPMEVLREQVFRPTTGRGIGEWLAEKRVIGAPIRRIDPRLAMQDEVSQVAFMKTAISERLASQKMPIFARIRTFGDPAIVFNAEAGNYGRLWVTIKGERVPLGDVIQFAEKYPLNTAQKEYITELNTIWQPLRQHMKRLGIDIKDVEGNYLRRLVVGHEDVGLFGKLRGAGAGVVRGMERPRTFPTEAEGVAGRWIYEPSVVARLERSVDEAIDRISRTEMANAIKQMGKTPSERVAYGLKVQYQEAQVARNVARHFHRSSIDAAAGKRLSTPTLGKIEATFPEQAARLRDAIQAGDRITLRAIQKEAKTLAQNAQASLAPMRREYQIASAKARRADPRDVPWGMYGVEVPELRGYFFNATQRDAINKVLVRDPVVRPLRAASNIATAARTMVATLDLSVMFIQGLYVLGRRPDIWAKSTAQAMKMLVKPQNFRKYLAKNFDTILERVQYGGQSQYFEYFEAMPMLRRLFGKVPGGEAAIRQTYGRAEAFFGGWGEVARNGMWKAWRDSAARSGELPQLATLLDRMTGVTSTRLMGVGASQRALENLFLFAPRYTRANLAFLTDMFKGAGTITGRQALQSIGQTAMGGMAFYTGICEALGQEPVLDPREGGRFMTIEVDGHHYGIGGVMYGLVKMGAEITSKMTSEDDWDKPMDVFKFWDRKDCPVTKFMYSRTSALMSLGWGAIVEQEDYMGEPLESVLDYAAFAAEKTVVPIALQPAITSREEGVTPTRFAAEEMGMRTFPVGVFEQRNLLQDRYAQSDFGKNWDDLEQDEREKVRKAHPDLEEIEKEAEEMRIRRGGAEEQQWADYRSGTEFIQDEWRRKVEMYEAEVNAGRMSGYDFRNLLDTASAEKRGQYELMSQQYPDIYERFDDPSRIDEDKRFDVALNEYFNQIYGDPSLETPQGYDYEEARRREDAWRAKWGDEMYQRVREYLERDAPELAKQVYQAREMLQIYWRIEDVVLKQMGLQQLDEFLDRLELVDPEKARMARQRSGLAEAEKMISLARQRLLASNPQLAVMHDLFYGREYALPGAIQRTEARMEEVYAR